MGNKVVDSTIEFIKDADSGELFGYKLKDGTERGIVTASTDLTGGITLFSGGEEIAMSKVLEQSGVPVGLPGSGSFGNNGAFTLSAALPSTYDNGVYLYFPANAIYLGSASGVYYCIMSSTTAGVAYDNVYSSGSPKIPASTVPFACTGSGAYTQTTGADVKLINAVVPGGKMGKNGSIEALVGISCPSNGNSKYVGTFLGVSQWCGTSAGLVNQSAFGLKTTIFNAGRESQQKANFGPSGDSGSSSAIYGYSINTTVDVTASISAKLTVATDSVIISYSRITLFPNA